MPSNTVEALVTADFYVIGFFRISSTILFFFNAPATTEIYTLSLHDALPICRRRALVGSGVVGIQLHLVANCWCKNHKKMGGSEEHTSELQSRENLVCRLLLEKKKQTSLLPFIMR